MASESNSTSSKRKSEKMAMTNNESVVRKCAADGQAEPCMNECTAPQKALEITVTNSIEQSTGDVYLAFLWPAGRGKRAEAEAIFSNVLYQKEITLTPTGAFNLLACLYAGAKWAGTINNAYRGVNKKRIECFPTFDAFTVVAFQAESLAAVRDIKEHVRAIYNIGFSAVHITDTKDEAIKISRLLFNDNGLHFLNNASPYTYPALYAALGQFGEFLALNGVKQDDIIIDDSTVLALYGIRKNNTIDFLISDNTNIKQHADNYVFNDMHLQYHSKSKNALIFDPECYFSFHGFKFVSFNQLYNMKKKRHQVRDMYDCLMMTVLIEHKKIYRVLATCKQKWIYSKVKLNRATAILLRST